jgi:hypothetical protein
MAHWAGRFESGITERALKKIKIIFYFGTKKNYVGTSSS